MKEARIIFADDMADLEPLPLDDFSRFKEKVIMINTLKGLLAHTDKATFKHIAKKEGPHMTATSLKHALETIVDRAIKRVEP